MTDPSPHRARMAEATRRTILDAFLSLAHESNAVTVSVPAVAERAGVSIRTVYRYFPSKDDLQEAAAYRITEQAIDLTELAEATVDSMQSMLDSLWGHFAEQLPAIIAEHSTPAGRRLRTTRLDDARALMRERAPVDIDAETADLLVAVTSSSMFLELVDRMGHSPAKAARLATRLAELILADSTANRPR